MSFDRRGFLAVTAGSVLVGNTPASAAKRGTGVGLLSYSFGIRGRVEKEKTISDPLRFLDVAKECGATGVQLSLGTRTERESAAIQKRAAELELNIEGIVELPKDDDAKIFESQLATAKACGATVVRAVLLGGRRYELFKSYDEYVAFDRQARLRLARIEPLAKKHRVAVAIENHKDYRVEELADAMKRISSEWLGVCFDTGNNLALLDDPFASAEALAPYTLTIHLKDMGVEESNDGFLLSEVPLGEGRLDLRKVVAAARAKRPNARLNLEMITRDPLSIPCLTDKYWATMKAAPGQNLARMLAWVRAVPRKEPLPRISNRPEAEQVAIEAENVKKSIAFAANTDW